MALMQRFADVVNHLALGVVETRRAAIPDVVDDLGVHAAFERQPLVGIPFVMCAPVPRGDQDRDLRQLWRKQRVEPYHRAEARGVPRHLRAVEPRHHRRRRGAALAGDRLVIGLFLVLVHFARRKQLQPHLGFLWFFKRSRLCEYTRLGIMTTSATAWAALQTY